ncbi:MAG: hypothetical protein ACKVJU_15810 [Verrucomicrobiales bacterium]
MKSPKRYPANFILIAGGILIPLAVVLFGLLLVKKHNNPELTQNVVQLFPGQVLLTAIVSLVVISVLVAVSAFRSAPMKWWSALTWTFLLLILSVLGLIGFVSTSTPLDLESQWRPGAILIRVNGSQLVFGIVALFILLKGRSKMNPPIESS